MPITVPIAKGGRTGIQVIRPIKTQAINFGATATEVANAVGDGVVRVFSDVACNVTFLPTETAATTDIPIGAGFPEFIAVISGSKVGVISTTGTATGVLGTLWVSESA